MPDTKNKKPIGVFDSGVGGLSILLELRQLLPNEDFIFLADQLYVPYGEKSKNVLVRRVYKITDYFIKYHNLKMMVVACNTATCYTINELRKKYSFPIVGTVPAIKPASLKTKSGAVAVISTPATSKSKALKDLIKECNKSIDVLNIGCAHLENLVEQGKLNGAVVNSLLVKYLKNIKYSSADYLILGCTHYPFLKKAIQKIIGSKIKIIDSGEAITKQTQTLLLKNNLENSSKNEGTISYFTTGNPEKFSKVASKLLKNQVQAKRIKI